MPELAQYLITKNKKTKELYLDLGNCGLTELPPELLDCEWLETLVLGNQWKEYDFEEKEWLNKSSPNKSPQNSIQKLSPAISRLFRLKKLIIQGEQFDKKWELLDLSPLQELKNLQELYVSSSQVSNLWPLQKLKNLQLLYVSSSQVSNLSPLKELKNLQSLHISSPQLNDLSPLKELENLQQLDVSRTQVSDLSPLKDLPRLQILDVSSTQVSDLSPLKDLRELQILNISSTQVSDLSPLKDLKNLQRLDVSGGEFEEVGKISDLSPLKDLLRLQILDVSSTQVSDLSPLKDLKNLKLLNVSFTKVLDLLPLKDLENLQGLDLYYTKVSDLSPILSLIRNGREVKWEKHIGDIRVEGCHLTIPPREVVEQGNDAIIQWLTARNRRPILEAKVMFIGDSGYGKTHLIEMLLHGRLTRDITTTLGIERNRLEPAISALGPVRLNVWDLGGQEFMRSTHQFFFTTRTLYVLVTDARQGERREDLRHWLNLVQTLGENAPVLVVINKADTNDHDIDRERIQQEYPNIVDFVRTCVFDSPEKGIMAIDTIRDLKQKIDALVTDQKEMPSVFYEQREEWFTVKEGLEKAPDPYITIEAFRKLEFIHELPPEEQDGCLKQLNFVGSVISYFDDNRLSDTHVIDPKWIMDGVYAILNDAEIKEVKRGCFNFDDMARILPPKVYPKGKLAFLTDLMQKFRLCYPQRGKNDTFLLPDLFPDAEPPGIWQEKNPLRFRFNYDGYPPSVFMAQFIAAKYLSIEDEKRWRSGVVISDGQCRAIIRRSFSREYIEIEVAGPERQRRGFLRMIREVFYELHEPFNTLKPLEEIPYKKDWLDYWDLLKAEADGDQKYRITGGERIALSEVLDGYAVEEDRYSVRALHEKMDRMMGHQEKIQEINERQLELLLENKAASEAFFQKIDQHMESLLEKLPANHPIAEIGNAYLKATDLKLKFKLGHELLGGQFEAEMNVDAKKIFRQLKKDAQQMVEDFRAGHIFTKPD